MIQILFDFIKFYLILNLDVRRFLTPIVLLRWRSAASRMGGEESRCGARGREWEGRWRRKRGK